MNCAYVFPEKVFWVSSRLVPLTIEYIAIRLLIPGFSADDRISHPESVVAALIFERITSGESVRRITYREILRTSTFSFVDRGDR